MFRVGASPSMRIILPDILTIYIMVKLLLFSISHLAVAAIFYFLGYYCFKVFPTFLYRHFDDAARNPDTLFDSLVNYFVLNKPYLNPELTVKDVAAVLMTNRTYLSRAIRENDMVNFNYFVNSYRLREAVDIFRMDQSARIGETAAKCGFNSTAAFTMAFKLYYGMTPRQWKDYYLATSVAKVSQPAMHSMPKRRGRRRNNVRNR